MFFETVIRYLGGLLSAYALSGRQVLLYKADELGRNLLLAFNTATGMPAFEVDPDQYVLFNCTQNISRTDVDVTKREDRIRPTVSECRLS